MDFLDKIFDEFNNNSISGLIDELKGLYIKYLCNTMELGKQRIELLKEYKIIK